MGTTLRRICLLVQRRLHGDRGFVLLESLIAISLITVIMGAVGAEYISTLSGSTEQRLRASAIQLADSGMEEIRSMVPSDLLAGRDASSVQIESDNLQKILGAGTKYLTGQSNLLAFACIVNASNQLLACPSSGPNVATTAVVPQTSGLSQFKVYKYFECTQPSLDSLGLQTCGTVGTLVDYIKAVVVVAWNHHGCPSNGCSYATTSLINADSDQQFDDNQPLPPAPQIDTRTTAAQTVEVGDVVSVTLAPKTGTGVAPYFWSEPSTEPSGDVALSTLGLALSPAGVISGQIKTGAASGTTQIILQDSYASRRDTATIAWTVYPKLAFTSVSAKVNKTTDTVSVRVAATGGDGNYTFSDPTTSLPHGLSIAASGVITGTPDTPGVSQVVLRVADGTSSPTHSATSTIFTWTVQPAPAITSPGNLTVKPKSALSVDMSKLVTSGAAPYTYAFGSTTTVPSWLKIDPSTGLMTGTMPTTNTDVTAVTVVITDKNGNTASTTPFALHVSDLTLSVPDYSNVPKGYSVSVSLNSTSFVTGGSPNYTFTYPSCPSWLSCGSDGTISGTTPKSGGPWVVKATVTDSKGATSTDSSNITLGS